MKHAVSIIAIVIGAMLSGCNEGQNVVDPTLQGSQLLKASDGQPSESGNDGARTLPHKERATGALTAITATSMSFRAAGNGTYFGSYTEIGSHDYDQLGNITNGVATTTTSDGSTISGTYSGTFAPLPSGEIRFDVTVNWVQGTGRLAGVTGESEVNAILNAVGALSYTASGTLTFP